MSIEQVNSPAAPPVNCPARVIVHMRRNHATLPVVIACPSPGKSEHDGACCPGHARYLAALRTWLFERAAATSAGRPFTKAEPSKPAITPPPALARAFARRPPTVPIGETR